MILISGGDYVTGVVKPWRNWHEKSKTVKLDSFCIDQFEFPNIKGEIPRSKVTWEDANSLCLQLGKRLCSSAEWERACRGRQGWLYSYGTNYDPGRCNTPIQGGGPGNNPVPIKPSGFYENCVSPEGVADLNGSLSEWVSDPWSDFAEPFNRRAKVDPQTWRTLRGGTMWSQTFYGQDCSSRHGHPKAGWSNMDDGFRCCASVKLR